jgi:hypothetical protein
MNTARNDSTTDFSSFCSISAADFISAAQDDCSLMEELLMVAVGLLYTSK